MDGLGGLDQMKHANARTLMTNVGTTIAPRSYRALSAKIKHMDAIHDLRCPALAHLSPFVTRSSESRTIPTFSSRIQITCLLGDDAAMQIGVSIILKLLSSGVAVSVHCEVMRTAPLWATPED
jgi:hypothetical protein